MRRVLIVLCLACVALSAPAAAQESQCVAIENDAERLACYDAANGRVPRAPAERNSLLPDFSNLRGNSVLEPPMQVEIARVVRRPGEQYDLVTTTGEAWTLTGTPRRLPRTGERVLIQRVSVGGFVLTPETGEPFRVRRQ